MHTRTHAPPPHTHTERERERERLIFFVSSFICLIRVQTDTNMTVVEENGNAVTDNNPDDYMYFRRTSTTDRRRSRPSGAGPGSSIRRSAKTGTGTGIVIGTDVLPVRSDGSGTGINDVRADVDSVFDYVPDDVTHYDVYVTHM